MPSPLPEFDHPPLDEVVIGVQFEPLQGFQTVHVGLFWSRIRDRYPFTEDQAPLVAQQAEPPDIQPVNQSLMFGTGPFTPRCWFLDQTKNQLIQLQRDRFLRNWRQLQGTEPYPRFTNLIQEFKRDWQTFSSFFQEERLGDPRVMQCELSYVNKIERGMGWQDFSDLPNVFSLLRRDDSAGFLAAPELVSWQAKYKLPDGRGRLHVEMNPVFRSRDMKLGLSLNLTARGAPAGGSYEQVFAWFDLAHEWVVRAFHELTTPKMHEIWKERL